MKCFYRATTAGKFIQLIQLNLVEMKELTDRCQDCIVDFIGNCEDKNKEANCPMCNKGPITMKDLRRVQRRRKRVNPLTGLYPAGEEAVDGNKEITIGKVDLVSSTKLRALVRKLEVMRLEEPEFKALVFSQFTSFLGKLSLSRLQEGRS